MEVNLLWPRTPGLPWNSTEHQHLANPVAYRRDRRKDLLLQENGYLVLRFLAEDVAGKELDVVLDTIRGGSPVERRKPSQVRCDSYHDTPFDAEMSISGVGWAEWRPTSPGMSPVPLHSSECSRMFRKCSLFGRTGWEDSILTKTREMLRNLAKSGMAGCQGRNSQLAADGGVRRGTPQGCVPQKVTGGSASGGCPKFVYKFRTLLKCCSITKEHDFPPVHHRCAAPAAVPNSTIASSEGVA